LQLARWRRFSGAERRVAIDRAVVGLEGGSRRIET
jgi:hypothetical protein